MAKVFTNETNLHNIGDAIREKNESNQTYKPSEMAAAILALPTYPEPTGTKAISSNGVHDVKDYANANVNVPNSYAAGDEGKVVSSGALIAQTSTTKNANGTYDTTTNNEVVVNVPNTYGSGDEGKVVSNGALVSQGSQTITENGTYDTTLVAELIANISGGGGGSTNILSGTDAPTASVGSDGAIYLQYKDQLPSGYTPIEYIQSSGTQRIDTGVPARVQLKAVIDCKWESSGDQTVLGGSSNINDNAIYLGYNSSNSRTYVGYAGSWHDFNTGAVDQIRHLWEIDLKTGAQSVTVDGEVKATTSNSFTQTTSSNNLFLFSRSNGGAPFSGKVYGIEIYDYLDNEALIRDFVPAKRDSDDVLGMYDLVNDVFYTNTGSGTFTSGPEIPEKSIKYAYLKVNGSWQPLIGSGIDDVNTGN